MFSVIVAGRLLGAALACGLNVYATIALLGIASRLGWIDFLPLSLRGLENGILIGVAITLFAAKAVSSAIPLVDTAFEAVHTVVRPVAALALAWLALDLVPWPLRLAGTAAAGSAAFAAHAAKVGLRLVVTTRRAARVAISFLEDLAAIGLAVAALLFPVVSVATVALFLGLMLFAGPALWRATAFGTRALFARVRGFFGTRDWRDPAEMPARLRALIPAPGISDAAPRAQRAAIRTGRATGRWRNGWLVLDHTGSAFLYGGPIRPRRIPIVAVDPSAVHPGFLADAVDVGEPDARFTLCLLKDGPPVETTLGALRAYTS